VPISCANKSRFSAGLRFERDSFALGSILERSDVASGAAIDAKCYSLKVISSATQSASPIFASEWDARFMFGSARSYWRLAAGCAKEKGPLVWSGPSQGGNAHESGHPRREVTIMFIAELGRRRLDLAQQWNRRLGANCRRRRNVRSGSRERDEQIRRSIERGGFIRTCSQSGGLSPGAPALAPCFRARFGPSRQAMATRVPSGLRAARAHRRETRDVFVPRRSMLTESCPELCSPRLSN
jgi:hypothetical protein